MPVAPLFVTDLDTLKKRLRLQNAKAPGTEAVIEQVLLKIRVTFYQRVGDARIATIKAVVATDSPTSAAQLLRADADSVEVDWVRKELLRSLPVLWLDASGIKQQTFNDEGAFAAMTQRALNEELLRLEAEVEAGILRLIGQSPSEGSLNVSTIGPSEPPDLPGATLWPSLRRSSSWGL